MTDPHEALTSSLKACRHGSGYRGMKRASYDDTTVTFECAQGHGFVAPRCSATGRDGNRCRSASLNEECVYCGDPATTRDHVVPRGRPDSSVTVPACLKCNSSKGDRTPDEWLRDGLYARNEGALTGPLCENHNRIALNMKPVH